MNKATKEILENKKLMNMIKKGEKEIKKNKKIMWKYKNIVKNKLKKPINLKQLYYEQFKEVN